MELNSKQEEQFNRYYDLLIEWNSKINLTAITDKKEVWLKHFEDSISISNAVDMDDIQDVIDIGTGAGFPGIPIKIMYPHINLTLLDSLNKRIIFLNHVIEELELDNVTTVHGRAEDYGHDMFYREKYDLCVSRAVANLSSLCELCIPFVHVNGKFVSYKSEKAEEEIKLAVNAYTLLGVDDVIPIDVKLSSKEYDRKLIVFNKMRNTPERYPRKAGIPVKKPL